MLVCMMEPWQKQFSNRSKMKIVSFLVLFFLSGCFASGKSGFTNSTSFGVEFGPGRCSTIVSINAKQKKPSTLTSCSYVGIN